MKKVIILIAILLLGVCNMSARRQVVYLSFANKGLSAKKKHPNRTSMRIPIDVVYDSDTNILEIIGPESLQAEIYIYDMSGTLEDYSLSLNSVFYMFKPGTHVILIKGDGWEAEGTLELQ